MLLQEPGGSEREIWHRQVDSRKNAAGEQVVRLPGEPGEIVRLALAVSDTGRGRFAWGRYVAPRVLGAEGRDPFEPAPLAPAEEARADGLRQAVARANVLLVILDAGRAQQFGAYGYTRATTPEIDRIAGEGVVFERVYTPAAYTLGAMSSLWTSQYPDRHHSEVSFSAKLPKDRLTLAELLSAQGIHTAGWVANSVAGRLFGFDRGFAEFDEVYARLGSDAGAFRQVVPQWLKANRDRRFFAYVHFREPHFPYDPPPPFDTRFGPDGPIPKSARRNDSLVREVNQGRRRLDAAEARPPRAPLRRRPRLRGPGDRRAAPGARGRGALGAHGRDRGRRPRRGARTSAAGSATTSTSTSRACTSR